jgi:hypothetical protein
MYIRHICIHISVCIRVRVALDSFDVFDGLALFRLRTISDFLTHKPDPRSTSATQVTCGGVKLWVCVYRVQAFVICIWACELNVCVDGVRPCDPSFSPALRVSSTCRPVSSLTCHQRCVTLSGRSEVRACTTCMYHTRRLLISVALGQTHTLPYVGRLRCLQSTIKMQPHHQ